MLRFLTKKRRPSRPEPVYGHDIAPPRLTRAGVLKGLLLLGPPALLFIIAMDLLVGAVVWSGFGVCVTVWCLF